MIKKVNECLGCVEMGMECIGKHKCPNMNIPVFVCDTCKDEFATIYHFDGKEMCIMCIKNNLEVVKE